MSLPKADLLKVRAREERGGFTLDIDAEIPLKGITALFGKSGAGKSSLLRVIAGLDKVSGGYVEFDGDYWQKEDEVWLPAHKRRVGYVFQHPSLFEHLSVNGNLDYARKRSGSFAHASGKDLTNLSELGIDSLLNRKVSSLSGGEKQRVTVARALISNPGILLLDEPVSALDAQGKEEVLGLIQRVHKTMKTPMIYVSHSLDEVAQLSDQICLIRDGKITGMGATVDMLLHPEIARETDNRLETIIDANVSELDKDYGLCRLAFSGGHLWVANQHLKVGDKARARIMASDLSLTLEHQLNTSIQNIIAAKITAIRESGGAQVVVELDSCGCRLLAQLTRRSSDNLGLVVGKQVYAQIKSVALLS